MAMSCRGLNAAASIASSTRKAVLQKFQGIAMLALGPQPPPRNGSVAISPFANKMDREGGHILGECVNGAGGSHKAPSRSIPILSNSSSSRSGTRSELAKLEARHKVRSPEQGKFVDPSGAHNKELAETPLRALEDAPTPVLGFSEVSHPEAIRSICHAKVPGWANFPKEAIVINQIQEGLSNQNFKVHLEADFTDRDGVSSPCVLFRAYGKDSDQLYDGALELRIVTMLSAYGIAPRVYASDDAWRIEEWHFSVPLLNRSMRNPSIFVQVAAHLGRLHKISSRPDFPSDIGEMKPVALTRFEVWGEGCRRAAESNPHPEYKRRVEQLPVEEMLSERAWLASFLSEEDPQIRGSGLDVVFSHWDCQENNILQTLSGLRWIDFEYSGMEYQAWDIASYFVECTIDYLVGSYPFYKVNLSDFPSEPEMRLFCSVYLSEYLETEVRPDDLAVSVLLERVKRFTLASHHLWSLWSVMRAAQAPTFHEFDYLHYAQSRWFMYKWTKRQMLHSAT